MDKQRPRLSSWKYHPTKRDLWNHVSRAITAQKYCKDDQESLGRKTEERKASRSKTFCSFTRKSSNSVCYKDMAHSWFSGMPRTKRQSMLFPFLRTRKNKFRLQGDCRIHDAAWRSAVDLRGTVFFEIMKSSLAAQHFFGFFNFFGDEWALKVFRHITVTVFSVYSWTLAIWEYPQRLMKLHLTMTMLIR